MIGLNLASASGHEPLNSVSRINSRCVEATCNAGTSTGDADFPASQAAIGSAAAMAAEGAGESREPMQCDSSTLIGALV